MTNGSRIEQSFSKKDSMVTKKEFLKASHLDKKRPTHLVCVDEAVEDANLRNSPSQSDFGK